MDTCAFPTSSTPKGCFLMPNSSTFSNSVSGEEDGLYIAIVVADPKPGVPSGGIFLNRLAFLSSSAPEASVSPWDMDGNEALVLRYFLTGSVEEGRGRLVVMEGDEVTALENVTDFGDTGGDVELDAITGCQRSSTDDFLVARGLVGGAGGATTGLSNCELILTIL